MKATGRQAIAVRPVHRSENRFTPRTLPPDSPEDLIRFLADQLSTGTDDRAEEILFDAEIDGSRYLLVRMPKCEKIHLSPREQEIVRMVAEGHPNKIIAGVLNISSWTVCTHLRRIFAKLGVGSRAAMIARVFDGRIPGQSL